MILGLIVLALFLVACARQGDESAFAGQATKRLPDKLTIEKQKMKLTIEKQKMKCACVTPSHVNIKCTNDNWNNKTNFDYFEQQNGLKSSQNSYGAFCIYSKNLVPEISFMGCNSFFKDKNCDYFCKSQLDNTEIAEINNNLKTCVNYFANQCNGEVTVEGAYGSDANSVKSDWWTVYGLCGEQEKEFGGK